MTKEEMKQKLLSATGPELSRLLGEVLGPIEHDWQVKVNVTSLRKCRVCGSYEWPEKAGAYRLSCSIPLTPAEAFKWFRLTEHPDTLDITPRELAIMEWFRHKLEGDKAAELADTLLTLRQRVQAASYHLLHEGESEDFLIIAALCKLEDK